MQESMVLQEWVLHKGGLACSSRCSRRLQMDDADSDKPSTICSQLSRWSCTALHHHANNMSIIVRHLESSLRFSSSLIFVSSLRPDSHHSAVVMLHTWCYRMIGKSFFIKCNDCPLLNIASCWNAYRLRRTCIVTSHLTFNISK